MWEKIAKEMQLPWRAAEAMHWQIGEVEMAQRANVPVFHLMGQGGASSQSGATLGDVRPRSNSPPTGTGPHPLMLYTHTHNHSLPQIPQPLPHPISPIQTRARRNSSGTSPSTSSLRHRADSARSVPASAIPPTRTILPPLGEVTGPPSQTRYILPPVMTPPEIKAERR
ncbi:hypothetical protein M433DRAFT_8474 [Acidomyces richmondensis BFW]|nr:MAG: hypothetical protein FE78DRAFT_30526 [Acidomyces sp. 'richmondensis']KYG40797.1 hypothetical protein M433DRAFT_8474 [Acidomyces richmondensis BFW]